MQDDGGPRLARIVHAEQESGQRTALVRDRLVQWRMVEQLDRGGEGLPRQHREAGRHRVVVRILSAIEVRVPVVVGGAEQGLPSADQMAGGASFRADPMHALGGG